MRKRGKRRGQENKQGSEQRVRRSCTTRKVANQGRRGGKGGGRNASERRRRKGERWSWVWRPPPQATRFERPARCISQILPSTSDPGLHPPAPWRSRGKELAEQKPDPISSLLPSTRSSRCRLHCSRGEDERECASCAFTRTPCAGSRAVRQIKGEPAEYGSRHAAGTSAAPRHSVN